MTDAATPAPVAPLILHHYPLSLFAEKIRRILAYKNLPWRSVEQPNLMPKPDLTPLTGGYRKVPVLQVGADVYCDTACIARRIEELYPDPPCIPADGRAEITMLEEWADHRFAFQCVPSVVLELLPAMPDGILDDRAKMSPLLSKASLTAFAPHTREQSLLSLDLLEERLASRAWLVGDSFTLADAACYHPLWFLRHSRRLFEAVERRPALSSWMRRIDAFGPGASTPMTTDEAMAIARDSKPTDLRGVEGMELGGIVPGDAVAIRADDYGTETVCGIVRRITREEITVLREDRALGEIAVHFPRSGYVIAKV
jgi:glutathione S-transferase